ncbi:MAG: peptide chain release factor 1 [Bdellovibrionales bacterium]|nr:peptide chain release factor 1 [Bdellovibrionales bacterium]NQZ18652.1 peptide chain release factor 1 [Bdellovibrionales bacterium]
MFDKLDDVEKKYESLNHQLQNPEVTGDQNKFRALMKEQAELEKVVRVYREYKDLVKMIADNKQMLAEEKDEELREMAKEEIDEAESKIGDVEQALKISLLPKDPNDDKNIILEIRAGAGGDEASLFAEELFTAYKHYSGDLGFRTELLSFSAGNVGGAKEIVAMITGDQVYSRLKYESGVHRVQRVPKTESQGRVHTSTVTVAVIPEAEEVEVKIDAKDIRIDVMRASGAGGQHVNTTDSAVRITHNPSGIVVYCQEGKSQHANKDRAMKILMSRLKDAEEQKAIKEASDARLSQIGTGDRSERIRTYNFPQGRLTDHRIGLTVYNLDKIIEGDMGEVTDALIAYNRAERLNGQED